MAKDPQPKIIEIPRKDGTYGLLQEKADKEQRNLKNYIETLLINHAKE